MKNPRPVQIVKEEFRLLAAMKREGWRKKGRLNGYQVAYATRLEYEDQEVRDWQRSEQEDGSR